MSEDYKKPFIPIWMEQAGFTKSQHRVLCHLWSRGQGRCFPSQDTIAEVVFMNIKTVKKVIKELEILGFVERKKRKAPGVRFSNEYILTGPKGTPIKNKPAQKEPPLTGPKETPSNRPKRDPGNDTSWNESPVNDTPLFSEEDLPSNESTQKNEHELFDYWKSFKELRQPKMINPERKTKLKTRLKDQFFRENWKHGIDKIAANPFMKGGGDRGWKADIDWFLAPGNLLKVIEGKYDNQSKSTANHTTVTKGIKEGLKL